MYRRDEINLFPQENINADGIIAFCHEKNKNEEEQGEEGNQLVSTLFCSNVAKQTVNEIPAQNI